MSMPVVATSANDEFPDDASAAKELIVATYDHLKERNVITRSIDRMPYTDDFECLFARVRTQLNLSRREVMWLLMNGRKRSKDDPRVKAPKWNRED